jgi:tellurite resistance protein TerC
LLQRTFHAVREPIAHALRYQGFGAGIADAFARADRPGPGPDRQRIGHNWSHSLASCQFARHGSRPAMIWFWLGYFGLVALLLFLDLGVLHRKNTEPSIKSAAAWTAAWVALGLSFSGVVYLMYEHRWLDIKGPGGADAAVTYVSAYLLEQALSVDNIFVMSMLFKAWRIPMKYQHRVLFWGILGAIVFRIAMLGGGIWLAKQFDWIFYVFGGFLAFKGFELLKDSFSSEEEDEEEERRQRMNSWGVRFIRRFVRVVDGDYNGHFRVKIDGRTALTTVALCLISIELADIVFALDSIPAVLSVSQESFIIITSNIFAIMGLRSLYFVLAGAMEKFKYLEVALGVLLIGIGVKMVGHNWFHISHLVSLIGIAGIIGTGVVASVIARKREATAEDDKG